MEHLGTLKEQNTNISSGGRNQILESDGRSNEDNLERAIDEEKAIEAGEDKKVEPEKQKDPNLIEWDGPDDPENPMNWPTRKKWINTVTMGMMTLCGKLTLNYIYRSSEEQPS
jgi:hypothetical protein